MTSDVLDAWCSCQGGVGGQPVIGRNGFFALGIVNGLLIY